MDPIIGVLAGALISCATASVGSFIILFRIMNRRMSTIETEREKFRVSMAKQTRAYRLEKHAQANEMQKKIAELFIGQTDCEKREAVKDEQIAQLLIRIETLEKLLKVRTDEQIRDSGGP